MGKSSSTAAVAAATGRSWEDWVELLDREGARELKHTAIARLTLQHMPESGSSGSGVRSWGSPVMR